MVRAPVSKTGGCRFESCRPCAISAWNQLRERLGLGAGEEKK